MATALELANRALLVLGEPRLAAFSDAGSTPALVRELFPQTFRELLHEDDWFWARKRATLAENTALTHLSPFEYAYDLPADLLEPINVVDSEGYPVVYQIEGEHLFSNYAAHGDYPVIIYKVDCLGVDGSGYPLLTAGYDDLIPDYWETAFGYTLAAELAFSISRDDRLAQRIRGESLYLALSKAKARNAMASPGYGMPDDDWGAEALDTTPRRYPLRS